MNQKRISFFVNLQFLIQKKKKKKIVHFFQSVCSAGFMDRYIPQWTNKYPYKLGNVMVVDGQDADSDDTMDSDTFDHSIIIANSLGLINNTDNSTSSDFSRSNIEYELNNSIPINDRILQYLPLERSNSIKNGLHSPLRSSLNSLNQSPFQSPRRSTLRKFDDIISVAPFRILDAPCLRNDFYSNLISWSNFNSVTTSFIQRDNLEFIDDNNNSTSINNHSNIIVGLNRSVYLWSQNLGAVTILNNNYLSNMNDYITCVSTVLNNSILLIGTKMGKLLLFDQKKIVANKPLFKFSLFSKRSITCISWFKNTNNSFGDRSYKDKNFNPNLFMCGDEIGNISIFKLFNNKVFLLHCFHSQEQQICGKFKKNKPFHRKQINSLCGNLLTSSYFYSLMK